VLSGEEDSKRVPQTVFLLIASLFLHPTTPSCLEVSPCKCPRPGGDPLRVIFLNSLVLTPLFPPGSRILTPGTPTAPSSSLDQHPRSMRLIDTEMSLPGLHSLSIFHTSSLSGSFRSDKVPRFLKFLSLPTPGPSLLGAQLS